LLAGRAFVYNLYPFRYFLEDTLIGFNLNPFNHSFRKRLNGKPKFYFFDTGVVRALRNILNVSLEESTSLYGETFEHFISQA
jgi:predicted AAA+ superfamily ATPase